MTRDAPLRVLMIGASYGLLPAAKIVAAGHRVTVVGRQAEINAIRQSGVEIEFGTGQTLTPPLGDAALSLAIPEAVEPADFDLVLLAVQEPQAHAPEIAALLARIADRRPVASLMNMPPPPFLHRLPDLPPEIAAAAYPATTIWSALPAKRMTMASPDAQAVRPDPAHPGRLRVTLASNFKFAPFARAEDQQILSRLAHDASRVTAAWGRVPVQMLARSSIYTPLAKWPMLVTGNCRCLTDSGPPLSIAAALRRDLDESRLLYDSVNASLHAIGAPLADLVGFDAYLRATQQLVLPSSLARALYAGALAVERIDLIVLALLRATDAPARPRAILSQISARIQTALTQNRLRA